MSNLSSFYTFPAIRGVQAGREYYIIMCQLRMIPKILMFDDLELDPHLRAQRVLNKSRVPQIAKYLLENKHNYVLSSITCSVDGEVQFIPFSEDPAHYNIGSVHIPMNTRVIVNDGQHRRAAIEQALKQNTSLSYETVSVVLFIDEGLRRSQQMFADLNRYALRPTQSLNILYDHRDPIAEIARKLAIEIPVFQGLTEMDKSSISNRSTKLFTLSGLYKASMELLADFKSLNFYDQYQVAHEFWSEVSLRFQEWYDVKDRLLTSYDLRREYIHAHSIALVAIGRVGSELLRQFSADWKNRLDKLKQMDWRRENREQWEGRVTIGGKISFSRNNLLLMTCALKQTLELPLSEDEREAEKTYQVSKQGGMVRDSLNYQ